jgi:hypothetical protein
MGGTWVEVGMLRRSIVAMAIACSSSLTVAPSAVAGDSLLGELAANPSLIAMTLPIDVWDYLGWRDTLADPNNTKRWQGYSKSRGDRERYTPQVVVNGSVHAIGSDRAAIERAIAESRKNASVMSVAVRAERTGDALTVALPEGAPAVAAIVSVWGLAKAMTVQITRGENKGRTVTYNNVVRRVVHLGNWTATSRHWTVPLRDLAGDGIETAAVLVQAGTVEKPSYLLGAATVPLR